MPVNNELKFKSKHISCLTAQYHSTEKDLKIFHHGADLGIYPKRKRNLPPIGIQFQLRGKHSGMIKYTVGQRKGLGIALGKPMFVKEKDPIMNTVTLCENSELFSRKLTASHINFIACDDLYSPTKLLAKIRYKHDAAPATVTQLDEDRFVLEFDEPQRAIAKGQSVVLYDGDTLVGGGIID